eukprot:1160944-Pelagomonas_calceolata.AAC.19
MMLTNLEAIAIEEDMFLVLDFKGLHCGTLVNPGKPWTSEHSHLSQTFEPLGGTQLFTGLNL